MEEIIEQNNEVSAQPQEIVLQIKEVIENFFGEENVDFSPPERVSIPFYQYTIRWPEATVYSEDENYRTTNYNFFMRLSVTKSGELKGITARKTSFTNKQWNCGYVHSHVGRIYGNSYSSWGNCCFGTSDLRTLVLSLSTIREGEFDIDAYMLLCRELDNFVHTESLTGGPYIRISELYEERTVSYIEIVSDPTNISPAARAILDKYIPFLLKSNVLKYNYTYGSYNLAMSNYDKFISISNNFKDWVNRMISLGKNPFSASVTQDALLLSAFLTSDDIRVVIAGNSSTFPEGEEAFIFKGQPVLYHKVYDVNSADSNMSETVILTSMAIYYIIGTVLKIVNYEYKEGYRDNSERTIIPQVYA